MAYQIFKPEWRCRVIRGVLFDMDGVILDTEKLYTFFWQEAAHALGYPMTKEQALGMRSMNRDAGAARLRSYFGPDVDYQQMRNKRIELMDAYVEKAGVEAKPGVVEILDTLEARGIPCAITTSSPIARVKQYLTPMGLFDRFQRICTGYDVPHSKPEPDIYLYGAACLGLKPEECIALEDSAAGLLSASRAGCMPVMVPDQDPPSEESLPLLYAIADSLTDVIALL